MLTPSSAGNTQTRIENTRKCDAVQVGLSRLARDKDMSETICVAVTRQEKYRFLVDFGENIPSAVADEPPPLGEGALEHDRARQCATQQSP